MEAVPSAWHASPRWRPCAGVLHRYQSRDESGFYRSRKRSASGDLPVCNRYAWCHLRKTGRPSDAARNGGRAMTFSIRVNLYQTIYQLPAPTRGAVFAQDKALEGQLFFFVDIISAVFTSVRITSITEHDHLSGDQLSCEMFVSI